MNTNQSVCNYAILRFLPYPETGEFVNVGVLVTCMQPCLLHFEAESKMPERAKVLFPRQDAQAFEAGLKAFCVDMERIKRGARDPKSVQFAFTETVRIRESVFRFGEIRTILTPNPKRISGELFKRYVRMEEVSMINEATVLS